MVVDGWAKRPLASMLSAAPAVAGCFFDLCGLVAARAAHTDAGRWPLSRANPRITWRPRSQTGVGERKGML